MPALFARRLRGRARLPLRLPPPPLRAANPAGRLNASCSFYFNIAVVAFGINTCITLYLAIWLPYVAKIHLEWAVYCPRMIPTATIVGLICGLWCVPRLRPPRARPARSRCSPALTPLHPPLPIALAPHYLLCMAVCS